MNYHTNAQQIILLKAHSLVEKILLPAKFFTDKELKNNNISRQDLKQSCNPKKEDIDQFVAHMSFLGYLVRDANIYAHVLIKACQEISSSLDCNIKPGISLSTELAMKQAYIKLFINSEVNTNEKYTLFSALRPYSLEYPRLIQAETLAACTAKCSFCPYETLSRKGEKMQWTLLEKFANEFKDFPDDFKFSFSPFKVSDPFLDDRLADIASLILESHPLVNFSLTTNGFYMPQEKIDELLAVSSNHPGRISISISLNTVNPEEYKNLMKLDIKRTIKNINRIRERQLEFISNGIGKVIITRISTDHVGDFKFRRFAKEYLKSSPAKEFFDFKIHNLNGWINHNAGEHSTKNSDVSVASFFPCDEWQRISILPNGDLSLCCMTHEASEDNLNFYHNTLKELHRAKLKKYARFDKNGDNTVGRKFSVDPCKSCDYNTIGSVNSAFDMIIKQPLSV